MLALQSIGVYLCLSTMAAAAIGNMISDVAGIGLAHYVEAAVGRFGIHHPTLNAQQVQLLFIVYSFFSTIHLVLALS